MPRFASRTALPGGGVDPSVVAGDVEGVDLVGEMVGMMMAQVAFAANAQIMSTTSQVDRRVISLLA